MNKNFFIVLIATLMSIDIVSAHGTFGAGGIVSGLVHPILGMDHLVAMISVGMLSVLFQKKRNKSILEAPAIFVTFLSIGALVSMYIGFGFSPEFLVSLSVVLLGIMMFFNIYDKNWIIYLGYFFIAFFGFMHGAAHGNELPVAAKPYLYVLGFMITSIFLHISGIFISKLSYKNKYGIYIIKTMSILAIFFGCYLLF